MAYTRISDAVVPSSFSPFEAKNTKENFKLFKSGVLQDDPLIMEQLNGGGRLFQTPSWADLADEEENIGSDDPNVEANPSKLGSQLEQSVRHNVNKSWASMRLQRELHGSDAMKRIGSRVSNYWNLRFNSRFVATTNGIIKDNIANFEGDMVVDKSTQGAIQESNRVSSDYVIDLKQTMGDAGEGGILMMHSLLASKLEKDDQIEYIRNSDGKPIGGMYREHEVIISDKCYIDTAGANPVHYCYLMGKGAFGWSEKKLPNNEATEIDPKPAIGNGQGGDVMWSRKQFVMHPYGFSWKDAACVGESPTIAELENAANWERIVPERKQVYVSVLKVNA